MILSKKNTSLLLILTMFFVSFPATIKAENQTLAQTNNYTQNPQELVVSQSKDEQTVVVEEKFSVCNEEAVKSSEIDNLIQQTEVIDLHSGLSCQQTIAIRNIEVQRSLAVRNTIQEQTIKVEIPEVEFNQFAFKNNQKKQASFILGSLSVSSETEYGVSQKLVKTEKVLSINQNTVTQVELKYLQVMRC